MAPVSSLEIVYSTYYDAKYWLEHSLYSPPIAQYLVLHFPNNEYSDCILVVQDNSQGDSLV